MYSVGDKIVHPMHGAGVIRDIVDERMTGQCIRYYVFSLPVGELVLKIPVESCGKIGIRTLSSPEAIEQLITMIPRLSVDMTTNWNQRYRENMERLKSGNLVEVARVIKTLMLRDRSRGLSNGERKMLHSAKQILLSEVVLVEGTDYKETERRVDQIMLSDKE
ncbi:MAG: CarD family transcriptional regulator [Ruminococcaceae bacterium]|jgi:CarD family transcriptional regulator|nr:CarD family transcriptional regulator [Oscillospiraceae bacterium]